MVNPADTPNIFIDRELRRIELTLESGRYVYPLNVIPDVVFQSHLRIPELVKDPETTLYKLYLTSVVSTIICSLNPILPFPINCAPKLVFLTLKDEIIEKKIDDIEGKLLSFQGRPFDDTIVERFEFFRDLHLDESSIDRNRLGAIEIYGDKTYLNLLREPRVSLVTKWSEPGDSPRSRQVNCITEIVPRGTLFYRYMLAIRILFSRCYLDLLGRKYACAYKFWICESLTKDLTDPEGFFMPR
ncbi:MAG: hypothetical protein K9W43_11445 [Candidatus Thorarchaeota archaeon]|nr:hypothetical protein [Candidatus Thorarchaeota archaeon]